MNENLVEFVFFTPIVLYGAVAPGRPAWLRLSSGIVGTWLAVTRGRVLLGGLKHPFLRL